MLTAMLEVQAEMKAHELPPKEERLFEGVMSKKVLTSKGASWQHRHAILSTNYLTFCKKDNAHQHKQIPQLVVSVDELWDVFEKHDSDHDGSLGNTIQVFCYSCFHRVNCRYTSTIAAYICTTYRNVLY